MWDSLRSLAGRWSAAPAAPLSSPCPVTITGIRFPADGSKPHLLPLTTTTRVSDGPDCCWGHVPDVGKFWKTRQAWEWRDIDTFRLEGQPLSSCDGLYVVFFSFDLESLPENGNFPRGLYGRERAFAGDAFVVKLKGNEIGSDLDEDGWAAWDDGILVGTLLIDPVYRAVPAAWTREQAMEKVRRLAIATMAHTWFADVNLVPNNYKDPMDLDAAMEIENIVKIRNVQISIFATESVKGKVKGAKVLRA